MNKERYDVLKVELKSVRLEADRILLRNYLDSDEDGFLTVFQDERSMAMDCDRVIMEKNDIFYQRISMVKNRDIIFLIIADKTNNGFIGYVLLNNYPEEEVSSITLGCSLVPEYQSKGYGYEAIGTILSMLKSSKVVKRVLANALTYNKPSMGLIRKLGFTSTGIKDGREFFILDL